MGSEVRLSELPVKYRIVQGSKEEAIKARANGHGLLGGGRDFLLGGSGY